MSVIFQNSLSNDADDDFLKPLLYLVTLIFHARKTRELKKRLEPLDQQACWAGQMHGINEMGKPL